jgi:hypothetical protein
MQNKHGVPEADERLTSRVNGCIRLGRMMVETLERHAPAGSVEHQIAAEISVLADELTSVDGRGHERQRAALVEAVTALWSYRSDFPAAARPFPMFEAALQAMQYLDRDASYTRRQTVNGGATLRTATVQYSQPSSYIAGRIDAALALMIDASLLKAVQSAIDTAADWIAAAREAGFDDGFELSAVQHFAMVQDFEDVEVGRAEKGEADRASDKLEAMIALACHLKPD